ncbi:hypothetical protein Tco_0739590 [Tanacetum coccineum]
MPVPPAGQVLPLDVLNTHTAWVKALKEIVGLMLMTMDPDIQKNLEQLGAYDMLMELKTLYAQQLLPRIHQMHCTDPGDGGVHDDLKRNLLNNEAKMVLYNALPKKEYERIFMCKTAKDIWQSLLITHQGNSQVKDNKIDLLVQQYEQFTILEEESIDSSFARFNTIITSLKALDEGFLRANYVRKFSTNARDVQH